MIMRAKVLTGAGILANYQYDHGPAVTLLGESLAIFRQLDNKRGISDALSSLGHVARSSGNYPAARAMYEESIVICRETADQSGMVIPLIYLGQILEIPGDYEAGRRHAEEGLRIARELGDKRGTSTALQVLAGIAILVADLDAAQSLLDEAKVLAQELRDKHAIDRVLLSLARIALEQRNYAAVHGRLEEGFRLARELGDGLYIFWALAYLATAATRQGQARWAAQLFGASEAFADTIGMLVRPTEATTLSSPIGEHTLATIRATLGEKAFGAAWAEGRAMTPEQAFAAQPAPIDEQRTAANDLQAGEHVAGAPSTVRASPGAAAPDLAGLTARELEVLRLVATGLTDAQVAEQLVVSRRTVNFHLSSIYSGEGGRRDGPAG
jgi:ATP/maltotriose-dependent transcriptional regulator MalT